MAIAYKGFNCYYVHPTTGEILQFDRKFEFCIASCTGTVSAQTNATKEEIISEFTRHNIDYNHIGGLGIVQTTYAGDPLTHLQEILPLTVQNGTNDTGRSCKLKLDSGVGYCVSQSQIQRGNAHFGSGTGTVYDIYDQSGTYLNNRYMTGAGPAGVCFIVIPNFNGTIANTAQGQYLILQYSSTSQKYQLDVGPFTFNANLAALFNGISPLPPEPTDPFSQGGISETGGGTGDFDLTSDTIDFPPLPTLGAVDSGFVTLFNPTLAELQALATYMWSNPLFDISAWKKIFADPMDAIIGLSIIPVDVPNSGIAFPIKVGNLTTDASAHKATEQFIEIQCGTINVNEYWGAYLDYDPYTKAEIYLPYCGAHQLSVDEIMGKTIEVRYHVDILSGACCAYVKCGDSVLYSFLGQCASSIPITNGDLTNVINGVMSAATAIGSMVATGGASAPLAVPQLAAASVNAFKPNVEKSGALSGTGGILALQKPYLILSRPRQALPENQNVYTGYPSFITATLGELSGYTEIEQIHLHDVPATMEELLEIESLLKSGVIL